MPDTIPDEAVTLAAEAIHAVGCGCDPTLAGHEAEYLRENGEPDGGWIESARAALAAAMPLCIAAYRRSLLADLDRFITKHGPLTCDDVFEILTDEPAALRSSVAAQTTTGDDHA